MMSGHVTLEVQTLREFHTKLLFELHEIQRNVSCLHLIEEIYQKLLNCFPGVIKGVNQLKRLSEDDQEKFYGILIDTWSINSLVEKCSLLDGFDNTGEQEAINREAIKNGISLGQGHYLSWHEFTLKLLTGIKSVEDTNGAKFGDITSQYPQMNMCFWWIYDVLSDGYLKTLKTIIEPLNWAEFRNLSSADEVSTNYLIGISDNIETLFSLYVLIYEFLDSKKPFIERLERELRNEFRLVVGGYNNDQVSSTNRWALSEDGSSLTNGDIVFKFSTKQANCMLALWNSFPAPIRVAELLEKSESVSNELRNLFKKGNKYHPAWKEVIEPIKDAKGMYRINPRYHPNGN